MKILIIGVGGIGSYIIEEIKDCVVQNQIDFNTKFYISDDDIVEIKNIKYQNYKEEDVGDKKTLSLERRYRDTINIIPMTNIISSAQLKEFDLIICCADNFRVRKIIFEYCHKNNILHL